MKNPINSKIEKRLNETVLIQKTGKNLEEWFQFIDRFTSLGLNEKELSRLIHDNFNINAFWQSAIISAYVNKKRNTILTEPAEEIEIVNSIQLQLPLSTLYNLWSDLKLRNTWFPLVSYTIIRENPKKFVQLLWSDSISIINLKFSKLDKLNSELQITHFLLPSKKISEEMQLYWKRVLGSLHESVSSELFHTLIMDI
jgi:hypothetical protein